MSPLSKLLPLLFSVCLQTASGAPVKITNFKPSGDQVHVTCNTQDDCYYIINHPEDLQTFAPATMSLADGKPLTLSTTAGPKRTNEFFRIEPLPISERKDTDRDGIDRVYELKNRTFLNSLNPCDEYTLSSLDSFSPTVGTTIQTPAGPHIISPGDILHTEFDGSFDLRATAEGLGIRADDELDALWVPEPAVHIFALPAAAFFLVLRRRRQSALR